MDYHILTKKCDGMCDSCECPPKDFESLDEPPPSCKTPAGCRENGCLGWCDEHRPDPAVRPDIEALKKRLADDPAFAAQVTGDLKPTTMEGLKRLAKRIKRERGIQHADALEAAAQQAGFPSFKAARAAL